MFLTTQLCNGHERILMLVAFNPESREARAHVLTEPFYKRHRDNSFEKVR